MLLFSLISFVYNKNRINKLNSSRLFWVNKKKTTSVEIAMLVWKELENYELECFLFNKSKFLNYKLYTCGYAHIIINIVSAEHKRVKYN